MERFSDKAFEIINDLHTERLEYESEYIPLIECASQCRAYEDTGLTPEEIQEAVNLFAESVEKYGGSVPAEIKSWVERSTWHVRKCNELCKELDALRLQRRQQEVVYGKWFMSSDNPDKIICSVCKTGFDVWKHESKDFWFCPHCGTRMDGSEPY